MHNFICPSFLEKIFNEILRTGDFLDKLKLTDITPVLKKNNPLEKANYRPVSALSVKSKIFERIMQMQVTLFTKKTFYLLTFVAKEKTSVHTRH